MKEMNYRLITKEQEIDLKELLNGYFNLKNLGNSYNWKWDDKVLFHQFYLIGLIDKPVLTKAEEYHYFNMGKPNLKGLIKERLLNKEFRKIDEDYLEN